jgi:hypothetical protein
MMPKVGREELVDSLNEKDNIVIFPHDIAVDDSISRHCIIIALPDEEEDIKFHKELSDFVYEYFSEDITEEK